MEHIQDYKIIITALMSALIAGFGVSVFLNRNFVSKGDYVRLKEKVDKLREADLETRMQFMEQYQSWIASTLMAIAYKVGVEVSPPPTFTHAQR